MPSERTPVASAKTPRPRRRLLTGRGRLRGRRGWIVASLFLLPLALIALRMSDLEAGKLLEHALSLSDIGGRTGRTVGSVLLVPLAAVIVVFFRVTLGIRVLGPFRSFLLAMAFQATGIPLGLLFLAVVLSIIVAIRRPLKSIRLPYYGRVSVVMSVVAATIAVALAIGRSFGLDGLSRVALFPIVALCLAGDAFASTLKREGWRSALWRASMTAAVAVLITELAEVHGLLRVLVRFPELLLLEVGLIIVIAEFLGHRILAPFNPPPKKKSRKRRKKSAKKASIPSASDTLRPIPEGLPAQAIAPSPSLTLQRSPAEDSALTSPSQPAASGIEGLWRTP